jgi:Zn-dependent M16 (insulinase) family peptidase
MFFRRVAKSTAEKNLTKAYFKVITQNGQKLRTKEKEKDSTNNSSGLSTFKIYEVCDAEVKAISEYLE